MLGPFRVLLEGSSVSPPPRQRFADLTEGERQKLLVEWNGTRTNYPRSQSIHQLFEEQVAQTPNAPAVSFTGAT